MDKDIISNLLKVAFPQYSLRDYTTSSGYTISLCNEYFDIVFEINAYPVNSPILFIFASVIDDICADMDVLENMFDMNQTGLFSFEIKGIK